MYEAGWSLRPPPITPNSKAHENRPPYAAQLIASNVVWALVDQGVRQVEVMIKGHGIGRDKTLCAPQNTGVWLSFVRDATLMPHNECRPP